ncbi:hypothetical protein B0H19DRAFT_231022 [Mycena capillaripes]|nr:hypothetical protein B0H19DRAFT_231022 [Mycena capillaripes]
MFLFRVLLAVALLPFFLPSVFAVCWPPWMISASIRMRAVGNHPVAQTVRTIGRPIHTTASAIDNFISTRVENALFAYLCWINPGVKEEWERMQTWDVDIAPLLDAVNDTVHTLPVVHTLFVSPPDGAVLPSIDPAAFPYMSRPSPAPGYIVVSSIVFIYTLVTGFLFLKGTKPTPARKSTKPRKTRALRILKPRRRLLGHKVVVRKGNRTLLHMRTAAPQVAPPTNNAVDHAANLKVVPLAVDHAVAHATQPQDVLPDIDAAPRSLRTRTQTEPAQIPTIVDAFIPPRPVSTVPILVVQRVLLEPTPELSTVPEAPSQPPVFPSLAPSPISTPLVAPAPSLNLASLVPVIVERRHTTPSAHGELIYDGRPPRTTSRAHETPSTSRPVIYETRTARAPPNFALYAAAPSPVSYPSSHRTSSASIVPQRPRRPSKIVFHGGVPPPSLTMPRQSGWSQVSHHYQGHPAYAVNRAARW